MFISYLFSYIFFSLGAKAVLWPKRREVQVTVIDRNYKACDSLE